MFVRFELHANHPVKIQNDCATQQSSGLANVMQLKTM